MKRNCILIATFIFAFLLNINSQTQSKVWYFDGKKVDFSSGTPTVQTHFSFSNERDASNGVYGTSNNTLFYVKGNSVYNNSGVFAGSLYTTILAGVTNFPSGCIINLPDPTAPFGTPEYLGCECARVLAQTISIVPVPGSCTKYYIIYFVDFLGHCSPHNQHFDLRYSIYDLSSNSVMTPNDISPSASSGFNDFFYYEYGDIAVSQLKSNDTRILYAGGSDPLGTGAIKKYIISSTGIIPDPSNPILYQATTDIMEHADLDISPDGTMLAWANLKFVPSTTPDAHVINLDANGNFLALNPYIINSSLLYTGIEFSPDNTKLYVGARNFGTSEGIYQIDLLNINPTFLLPGSANFGNSQLELAYDGKIYAAKSSTVLGVITNPNLITASFIDNAVTFSTPSVINNRLHTDWINAQGLFLLPDQIDGENYDDRFISASCCSNAQAFTISDPVDNVIDIAGSVTWSSTQSVSGSVRILSGATLTIAPGAIIQFSDTKFTGIVTNIDVQIGGKLVVSPNAVLTSIADCPSSMWDGIIIEGTPFKQIPANQGWVVLSSCELKNARRGVFVGGIVKNSGGILQATSATFRNNYTDVEFMPYAAPLVLGNEPKNISFFAFCNFIGDAFLNDLDYTDGLFPIGGRFTNNIHVILRSVKGIGFAGNNFKTDLSGVLGASYRTELRSIGIYSINSIFNVTRACNIIGPSGCAGAKNNFDNLFHGVYAQSSNSLKTFTVDQTNFTNCYYSLHQSGINYSTVTKNAFLVNTTIAAPLLPLCFGGPCLNYFDYTNQCSGFTHSENTFTVSGAQQMIGSIFNATGTLNNVSFHNDYTGLLRGTQTQLINGVNGISITGLQIKCNRNFTSIASDILSTSGILPKQGVCLTPKSPANNAFSHNFLPEGDIKVSASANSFIYTYFANPPGGVQVPLNYTAIKVTPSVCPGSYNYAISCELPPVGCGFPCWFGLAIDNSNSANSAKQVLLDGDATALYNAINSGMSTGSLKNLLNSKSPYLSDGVLIAYLQRTNTPPSGHIKDIIIANSPVTSAVKTVLDNMNLPNGIRNQINAAQTGTSARSQQEELVQYYESQKDLAINEAIRIVINDTITANTDSIIESLLKFDGTIKGKTDLTNLYISKGNYVSAQHLIDSLSALPCMNKHGKMLQHCKNLHQSNKDWFELNNDAQLKIDLDSLANDSLANGFSNAKSVFAMVNGKANYELVENPVEYHSMNIIYPEENSESNDEINSEIQIQTYPNPFKDEINVSIILPTNTITAKLQLIEIASGKIIEEQNVSSKQNLFKFNTTQLANGVYLIAVKGENVSPTYVKVINLK